MRMNNNLPKVSVVLGVTALLGAFVGFSLWRSQQLLSCADNLRVHFKASMLYAADNDDTLYHHFPVGKDCAEEKLGCASYNLKAYLSAHQAYGLESKHLICPQDPQPNNPVRGVLLTPAKMSYEQGDMTFLVRKTNDQGRPLISKWSEIYAKILSAKLESIGANIFLHDRVDQMNNFKTAHGDSVNAVTLDGGLINLKYRDSNQARPIVQ